MYEKTFYEMMDRLKNAQLPSEMKIFYPTVNELQDSLQGKDIEDFLPILLFYATDPFRNILDNEEYLKTVTYAKKLILTVNLT